MMIGSDGTMENTVLLFTTFRRSAFVNPMRMASFHAALKKIAAWTRTTRIASPHIKNMTLLFATKEYCLFKIFPPLSKCPCLYFSRDHAVILKSVLSLFHIFPGFLAIWGFSIISSVVLAMTEAAASIPLFAIPDFP